MKSDVTSNALTGVLAGAIMTSTSDVHFVTELRLVDVITTVAAAQFMTIEYDGNLAARSQRNVNGI